MTKRNFWTEGVGVLLVMALIGGGEGVIST